MSVIGAGSETYAIQLNGIGGSWLVPFDPHSKILKGTTKSTKNHGALANTITDSRTHVESAEVTLDFGTVAEYSAVPTAFRSLHLRNPHPSRALPITVRASSAALRINSKPAPQHGQKRGPVWRKKKSKAKDTSVKDSTSVTDGDQLCINVRTCWTVIVPPSSTMPLSVSFTPSHPGDFQGSLELFAPQSYRWSIPCYAFSGPRIGIPYQRMTSDIFLPVQRLWRGDKRHRGGADDQKSPYLVVPLFNRSRSTACEFRVKIEDSSSSEHGPPLRLMLARTSEAADRVLNARALVSGGGTGQSGGAGSPSKAKTRRTNTVGVGEGFNTAYEESVIVLQNTDRLFLPPGASLHVGIDIAPEVRSGMSNGGSVTGHLRVPFFIECLASSSGRGKSSNSSSSGGKNTATRSVEITYGPYYITALDAKHALTAENLLRSREFLDCAGASYLPKKGSDEETAARTLEVLPALDEFLKNCKDDSKCFCMLAPRKKQQDLVHDSAKYFDYVTAKKWGLDREDVAIATTEEDQEKEKDGKTVPSAALVNTPTFAAHMRLFVHRLCEVPSSTSEEIVWKNSSTVSQIYHILVTRPLILSGAPVDGTVEPGESVRFFVSVDALLNREEEKAKGDITPFPRGGINDALVYILDGNFIVRGTCSVRVVHVEETDEDVDEEESNKEANGDATSTDHFKLSEEKLRRSVLAVSHPPTRRWLDFGTQCAIGEEMQHRCTLVNRSGECIEWQALLNSTNRRGSSGKNKNKKKNAGSEKASKNANDHPFYLSKISVHGRPQANSSSGTLITGTLAPWEHVDVAVNVNGHWKGPDGNNADGHFQCFFVVNYNEVHGSKRGRKTPVLHRTVNASLLFPASPKQANFVAGLGSLNLNGKRDKTTEGGGEEQSEKDEHKGKSRGNSTPGSDEGLLGLSPSLVDFCDVHVGMRRSRNVKVFPLNSSALIPMDVAWAAISEGAHTLGKPIFEKRRPAVDILLNPKPEGQHDDAEERASSRASGEYSHADTRNQKDNGYDENDAQSYFLVPFRSPPGLDTVSTGSKEKASLLGSMFCVSFLPSHDGLFASTVSIVRRQHVIDLTILGRAGTVSLTSNLGDPVHEKYERSIEQEFHDSASKSQNSQSESIIDLGVIHVGRVVHRPIFLHNNGSLDIRVLSIDACTDLDPGSSCDLDFSWKMPAISDDPSIGVERVESGTAKFGSEYGRRHTFKRKSARNAEQHLPEIDWDECDFVIEQKRAGAERSKVIVKAQALSEDNEDNTGSEDDISNTTFPLVLRPGQLVALNMRMLTHTIGHLQGSPSLQVDTENQGRFRFCFRGVAQPKLEFSTGSSVSFGSVAVGTMDSRVLRFTNDGAVSVPWRLSPMMRKCRVRPRLLHHTTEARNEVSSSNVGKSRQHPIGDIGNDDDETTSDADEESVNLFSFEGAALNEFGPFQFEPSAGELRPGDTQEIYVTYRSDAKDRHVQSMCEIGLFSDATAHNQDAVGMVTSSHASYVAATAASSPSNQNDAPSVVKLIGTTADAFLRIVLPPPVSNEGIDEEEIAASDKDFSRALLGNASRNEPIDLRAQAPKEGAMVTHKGNGGDNDDGDSGPDEDGASTERSDDDAEDSLKSSGLVFLRTCSLNFGTIKIASKKVISFHLLNVGDLDCSFSLSFMNDNAGATDDSSRKANVRTPGRKKKVQRGWFSCVPSGGILRGRSHRRIDVKFIPMAEKEVFETILVDWGGGGNSPNPSQQLTVRVFGSGGTPALQVLSQTIDFGTAILGMCNEQELILKNNGNAETLASFEHDFSKDVPGRDREYTLAFVPPSPMLVPPHSTRIVRLLLTPLRKMGHDEHGNSFDDHEADPRHEKDDDPTSGGTAPFPEIDTYMVVQCTESFHEAFRVHVKSHVGTPAVAIAPRGFLAGAGSGEQGYVDFGTVLGGRTHMIPFSIVNKGSVPIEYSVVFARLSTSSLANASHHGISKVENRARWTMAAIQGPGDLPRKDDSKTRKDKRSSVVEKLVADAGGLGRLYETQPELFILEDWNPEALVESEVVVSENDVTLFSTSPARGLVEVGNANQVMLQYTPPKVSDKDEGEEDETVILIRMPFRTIGGWVRGEGGEPSLVFDWEEPDRHCAGKKQRRIESANNSRHTVFDFGTCRVGSVHNRTIHIMNMGHLDSTAITLEADPSDKVLNPRGAESASSSPSDTWQRAAAMQGFKFALETLNGNIPSEKVGKLHIRFTAKTPMFSSTQVTLLRLRLRYGTVSKSGKTSGGKLLMKNFIVKSQTAMSQIMLQDELHNPIRGSRGVAFSAVHEDDKYGGLVPVGKKKSKVVFLANKSLFPCDFMVSQSSLLAARGAFTVHPVAGTIRAKSTRMLRVDFAPIENGDVSCPLKIRTNVAAPPGAGQAGITGNDDDNYKTGTLLLETHLSGKAGVGHLSMHFLNTSDKNIQGLDFGLVLADRAASRTLVISNTGSVPVWFQATCRSPFYSLKIVRGAHAKKSKTGEISVSGLPPANSDKIVRRDDYPGASMFQKESAAEAGGSLICSIKPGELVPLTVTLSTTGGEGQAVYTGLLMVSTVNSNSSSAASSSSLGTIGSLHAELQDVEGRNGQQHLTATMRGQGGTVHWHVLRPLNLGIVPCNHHITHNFQLYNLGSLPVAVRVRWRLDPTECDRMNLEAQSDNKDTVNTVSTISRDNVGHTALLRCVGTSEGRKMLWRKAYRWVVAMLRVENTRRLLQGQTKGGKGAGAGGNIRGRTGESGTGKKIHTVASLRRSSVVAPSAVEGEIKEMKPDKVDDPLAALKRKGDLIAAENSQVVTAYDELRHTFERSFNLHQEIEDPPENKGEHGKTESDEELKAKEEAAAGLTSLPLILQKIKQGRGQNNGRSADRRHNMFQVAPPHTTPHLRVTPRAAPCISRSVHGHFEISLNLSRPGLFKASLIVEPQGMPGAMPYAIPFQCYGEVVDLAVDRGMDTPLDFGMVPFGERKILSRVVTNKGRVNTEFHVKTRCKGLASKPHSGSLAPGESVNIDFTYIPEPPLGHHLHAGSSMLEDANGRLESKNDEKIGSLNRYAAKPEKGRDKGTKGKTSKENTGKKSAVTGALEQHPVVITSVHSASAISLAVFGSGGASKMYLSSVTLEFDRCMLRRPTTKHIRIHNKGNATLTITNIRLEASDSVYDGVFRRGDDWPGGFPITIDPGGKDWLTIPVTFTPPLQQQFSALLVICTSSGGDKEVLVRGTGRAVDLAVSTDALQFLNTIVGNTYDKTITVRNTGDLGFRVKISVLARAGEQDDFKALQQSVSAGGVATVGAAKDLTKSERGGDANAREITGAGMPNKLESMEFTNAASRDVSVKPSDVHLAAFGSEQIIVSFKSSAVTDTEVVLQLESTHAIIQIPVRLHSGTANLGLSPRSINFGHFQANPLDMREKVLTLTNTGSVAFSYRIKKALTAELQAEKRALAQRRASAKAIEDAKTRKNGKRNRRGSVYLLQNLDIEQKSTTSNIDDLLSETARNKVEGAVSLDASTFLEPDPTPRFQLSHWSGRLGPGDSHEIYVRLTQTALIYPVLTPGIQSLKPRKELLTGRFREELYVETEVSGSVQFVVVQGHPDKAVLHGDTLTSFRRGVDFGACPVGSEMRRTLRVRNIGGYELKIAVQADVTGSGKRHEESGVGGLIGTWLRPVVRTTTSMVGGAESKQQKSADRNGNGEDKEAEEEEVVEVEEQEEEEEVKLGGLTIPANGGECDIIVTWTPTGSFSMNTAFTVRTSIPHLESEDDSPSPSSYVVVATGTGHYPRISIEPSIVNFGIVAVGYETSARSFVIRNHSACPVPWNIPSLPDMCWFSEISRTATNFSGMIPANGGMVEVGVVVRPAKKGFFSEDVMVCAPNMGNYRMMTISGEARVMHLRVVPSHLDFGSVERIGNAVFMDNRVVSLIRGRIDADGNDRPESDGVVSRRTVTLINDGDVKLSMRVGQGLSSKFGIPKSELRLADSTQLAFGATGDGTVSTQLVNASVNLEQSFGPASDVGGPRLLVTPGKVTLMPGEETTLEVELVVGAKRGVCRFETTIDILSVESGWSIPVVGDFIEKVHKYSSDGGGGSVGTKQEEGEVLAESDVFGDDVPLFLEGTVHVL